MTAASGSRKRRRLNDDDGEDILEYQVPDPDEIPDLPPRKQEITLTGQVIMIYSRDEDEPECISGLQLVLKGSWNMGIEG
jgi:hypothetical protein